MYLITKTYKAAYDNAIQNNTDLPVLYATSAKATKIVAYCALKHLYLTATQLKRHKCTAKCCTKFRKITECQYWRQKQKNKGGKNVGSGIAESDNQKQVG